MATNPTSPAERTCFQCHRPAVRDDGRCRYCILEAEASEAFWAAIVRHFPEAKYGDLSPERTIRQRVANVNAIEEWISSNVPSDVDWDSRVGTNHRTDRAAHCRTCGSEIVETVNGSTFNDGECGPCEYARYTSQPVLLAAAFRAYGALCDLSHHWCFRLHRRWFRQADEAIGALSAALNTYGKES